MKHLSEWKAERTAEEKKSRKKHKAIEEREAKLEVAKMKLERESKLRDTVTHHKDCQTEDDPNGSVAVKDEETPDENMNQVDASELPVDTSSIPICLKPQSWKTTNMDPNLLKTTMRLKKDSSGTNSIEPTSIEQEPARSTPSEERTLLNNLKELLKNTQNLSNKMDESHLICLDIKKIQNNKST